MTRVSYESTARTMYQDVRETDSETVRAAMKGRGGSAGVATGRCRVVEDLRNIGILDKDTILVHRIASEDLIRFIPKVKALITERGGLSATACLYAREHEVPAAVGVRGVMTTLRDGDLVRVDGAKGTVEVLE